MLRVIISKYFSDKQIDIKDKSQQGWMTRYHVPTKKQSFNSMHSFVDPHYNDHNCKDMFSFSFVRNPYTRIISLYKFIKRYRHLTFLGFCQYLNVNKQVNVNQYKYLTLQNEIPLDFVGRYENIKEDFNNVCEEIGIPERYIDLGFEHKQNLINYKNYYCDESKKIIDNIFDMDFKTFNYKKEL